MNTSIRSLADVNAEAWSSQKPIPINHPLIPQAVRHAVLRSRKIGRLYRVSTMTLVEWWLMGPDGDLLEMFWTDGRKCL